MAEHEQQSVKKLVLCFDGTGTALRSPFSVLVPLKYEI